LAAALTETPGASEYFAGGAITYTNDAKELLLEVPYELLEKVGAVSEEVACSMADRIRVKLGTDIGIAITGVAGPDEAESKEAGTIFVAVTSRADRSVKKLEGDLGREGNRRRAVQVAADLACDLIQSTSEW
jgi:nicotinamide-nucleotide amidase